MPEPSLSEQKTLAEIRNLEAATNKAKWDAENAKHQHSELTKRRPFLERVLTTAQFTVILALVTLLAQTAQFTYTAKATRDADAIKKWKDAVSDVSFDGGSKSASAAMELETFFGDKEHGGEAKAIVATIVPNLRNNQLFDHIFTHLKDVDGWEEPSFRTKEVAQEISADFMEMARPFFEKRIPVPQPLSKGFRDTLSNSLKNGDPVELSAARWREYQIDTATNYLIQFWAKNGSGPIGADRGRHKDFVNFRGIILYLDDDQRVEVIAPKQGVLDFSDADFTNAYLHRVIFPAGTKLNNANFTNADLGKADLSGTTLDEAKVEGASFDSAPKPINSSWKGVEWWKAKEISIELCKYLRDPKSGAPQPPNSQIPISDPCLKKAADPSAPLQR